MATIKKNTDKFSWPVVVFIIGVLVVVASMTMKILHWQGHEITKYTGYGISGMVVLYWTLTGAYKKKE